MIKNFTDYISNSTANYIKDTVVAITGGGSGFGRLIAFEVLKMGGKVVVSDINAKALEETVAEGNLISEGNIIGAVGSVANYTDVQDFIAKGVKSFGRIDSYVSNAGTMPLAPISDHKSALPAWDLCIDVNLKGTLYGMSATYDLFIEQGYGHFVTISSIYGNHPVAGSAVYQATKIGVRYLSSSLRGEANGKIKVSNVNPTAVPGTNLNSTVLNIEGAAGITGQFGPMNAAKRAEMVKAKEAGEYTPYLDQDSPLYMNPTPEEMVWAIMFVLNQPKGVNIGDITMRATGEAFVL